jgi:hypothetical protein
MEDKKFNPKGGRPQKPIEETTYYYRTRINLTKEETEKFNKLHQEQGGTKNDFIKNCIFTPKTLHRKRHDYRELIYQINKVGVNINQIAHKLNQNNSNDNQHLKNEINEIRAVLSDIYNKVM